MYVFTSLSTLFSLYSILQISMQITSSNKMNLFVLVYSLALLFNMISSLALLCVGGENGAQTFGVSLLYLFLFVPCSFLFWYRPVYQALK